MKKILNLGKSLNKQEQKKITGGYSCSCVCNNSSAYIYCTVCNTGACFSAVYGQCGGAGATCNVH